MVEVSSNWRDAYKRRANYVSAAIGIENQRAKASSEESKKSSELANAALRSALKDSNVQLESSSDEREERIKKGGWDGFVASGEKALDTPVVKGVLDALSIGTYTTAAVGNSLVEAQKAAKNSDNPVGEFIGKLGDETINHNPIVMGVKGAFGDDDSKRTWADVIKNEQGALGLDTENDAAKWAQGLGGFAGDVLLDPTTYMTLGGSALAKGASAGFREGSKAAKEVAGRALADAERAGASLKGTEEGTKLSRIAENPKGRIGTAIDGALSQRAIWKAERKQEKLDRKAIRQGRNDTAGKLDESAAKVGSDPKAIQDRITARKAESDAREHAKAVAETERKAKEAEAKFAAESKVGPDHLADAIRDIKGEEPVTAPAAKVEDLTPQPKQDLNSSKGAKEELQNEVKLAEEPKPAEAIVREINGKVIDKYEPLWVKPKYRDKNLKAALSEPSFIQVPMKVPNWNEVYKDLKADPKRVIQYGEGDNARVTTAAKLVANTDANGGPDKFLPYLGLPTEITEKHASEFRKVPKVRDKEIKNSDYIGLAAEGKQKRKEQKIRGKSHKNTADEKDFGPQQADFAKSAHKEDGTLDEDVIFSKADDLLDEESDFMYDEFNDFVADNPDHILKVQDPKTGVETQITLEKFADLLEGYKANPPANAKLIEKYLKSNVLFFSKFDEALDPETLDEEMGAWQKAVEEWEASKNADETVDNAVEEVGEADPLNDILEEEFDLIPNMGDAPNPKAWNAERAKEFKIDPEHADMSPDELLAQTVPMEARDIRSWITSKEGGISKAELDELRAFTGKTDAKEVADEFIKLRKTYNDMVKKEANKKPAAPTRIDEVKKVMDEAEIKAIAQDNAKMADEILESPVALDEVAQRSFRIEDYDRVLKKEIEPELHGILNREHANDAARQAVKASIEFQTKHGLFKTGTGYDTMTQSIETGGGWRPDRWGSASQIAMHKSIFDYVRGLDYTGASWKPTAMRKAYMTILEVADKELRAMGVEPFLNQVTQKVGKKGINHAANLSIYDIFKAMETAGFKKPLETIISGGWSRGYQITPIQGAAETIVRLRASGVKEDEIYRRVMKQLLGGKDETFALGRPKEFGEKNEKFRDNQLKNMANKSGSQMSAVRTKVGDAKKIAAALMAPETFRAMNVQMLVNHAAHASALGKNVDDLAAETVETLRGLANAGDAGDVLGYLRGQINDIANRFAPQDVADAKGLFHAKMEEHFSEAERISMIASTKRADAIRRPEPVIQKNLEENAKVIDSGKNAGKPAHELFVHDQPQPNPNQAKINKSHVHEARAAVTQVLEQAPKDAEDFEIIGASIAAAAMRKIHPFQKYVNPRLGLTDNVYRQINSGLHSVARQQSEFHGSLLTHLAKYGDEALLNDFRELQRIAKEAGKIDKNNPLLLPLDATESMRELYGIVTTMFSKSAYNVFARNGIGASHFNTLAKSAGIPDKWRFRPDGDEVSNSALWAEWQGIEEKGVLDFLSRMHSVAVKASQDIAIAASFSDTFGKAVPTPGHVKITWTNRTAKQKEESVFYDLIDKDLYYPKEIAMQVTQVEKLLRESRHIDPKTGFGKFIVNVFDPVTNALKASQTTVRPGHWTISFAGDLLRNHLAGVNSMVPYKHAGSIMMAGKKLAQGDEDEFFGAMASIKHIRSYSRSQEINNGFVGTSTGKGVHLYVGGKKVNVDYETMNKLLRDVVMLPKHRGGGVLEDRFVGENVTNGLARKLEKATDFVTDNQAFDGKLSLNEWAARRDNLMRVSLAVDYASKRKWKNLQEMKDGMEEYVTKWAPTSTDFTAFEAKYARRTLLYYTWLRGITPRVIDAAMTKPGVTTMVPKALYNMAYANGLNPESIGNPFPEDGMFPSYYKNNILGPQWQDDFGMWGINPSSPVIEVGNTFSKFKAGNPVGNVEGAISQLGGMASPFARIPAELATGTQASTGVPIEDNAQYLLDNLGGSWLSSLSRATGKTVGEGGIVDRTDSAAKGTEEEQGEHAKLQLINFLSGLKLTDYQSLAAQKAAAYDMADQVRQKAILEERQR